MALVAEAGAAQVRGQAAGVTAASDRLLGVGSFPKLRVVAPDRASSATSNVMVTICLGKEDRASTSRESTRTVTRPLAAAFLFVVRAVSAGIPEPSIIRGSRSFAGSKVRVKLAATSSP